MLESSRNSSGSIHPIIGSTYATQSGPLLVIEGALQDGPVFAAFGALHLPGDEGVLNLLDQAAVQVYFKRNKVDQVYLAAAKVGGIHANNSYPADFIYENLMIEANVIHQAFSAGVTRLLQLGSSCIYPRAVPQPMRVRGPLRRSSSTAAGRDSPPTCSMARTRVSACSSAHQRWASSTALLTHLQSPNLWEKRAAWQQIADRRRVKHIGVEKGRVLRHGRW